MKTYTPAQEIAARIETQARNLTPDKRWEMYKTIECESDFNRYAHNLKDPEGGAKGVAQFLPSTFNRYAPLAGLSPIDIWDNDHQVKTMAYMFSIGEEKQWTCWKDLFDKK